VRIRELCTLENGRAFRPTECTEHGLPIVRIQNLNRESATFNHFAGEAAERYRLRGGELLFAWSGTPGTSFGAHVWRGGDAVLNQHIFRVDFDESAVEKRFFRHAINQKLAELIDVAHGGVGLRHVTKGVFENTKVVVPPLLEQERIADKLDALLTRVASCRGQLDRVPGILKRFRQSVLVAATSGELTREWREERGHTKDWVEARVEDIAFVGTGSTPLRTNSAFFAKAGTPWITSAMTGLPFVTQSEEFVTDAAIVAHRLKKYPSGTLLVAMYGEGKTRGQVTELRIEATINQACAAIAVNESLATKAFVRLALEANYLQMRDLAEGGNQPNLNLSKIKEFPLSLPPLNEQRAIVDRMDRISGWISGVEAQIDAASRSVASLTRATLAKALRGELVPQSACDAPASALLTPLRVGRSDTDRDAAAVPGKRTKPKTVRRPSSSAGKTRSKPLS
jgi:type I restriction enzyme S subunit